MFRYSARISKKVEGGKNIKIGYFLNAHPIFKGWASGDITCRAVIVPGTTIGSGGGIPPTPPGNSSTVQICTYVNMKTWTYINMF